MYVIAENEDKKKFCNNDLDDYVELQNAFLFETKKDALLSIDDSTDEIICEVDYLPSIIKLIGKM